MRIRPFFLVALISLPAYAQVSVDQRAIDQLAPAKPSNTPTPPAKPAAPAAKPYAPANKPAAPIAGQPQRPTTPPAATVPPPNLTLPPPIVVPTRSEAPPSPPTLAADAPTTVERRKDGLRLVFGAGRSDLNPATDTGIDHLVHGDQTTAPTPDSASYTVTSYAPGTPEDASAPRRLSLARALAIRASLIAKGVASVRIYVRALGPTSPGFADGPADRADIVVSANPVPPPSPNSAASNPTKPDASH
jgi:outer membrane protein OmpA-like peptidoglycan-associated protein